MKIITASQMRTLDQVAIKQHGIAANTLMDKAGQQLAKVAANYFNLTDVIGVLAGPGNNGGDALVAAGYLKSQGFQVREFPIDAAALQAKVVSPQMQKKLSECSGFIDGLFGVGLNRKLGSFAIELINLINSSNKLVLSADIPSGINADSGEMQGAAIKANHTITFALPKPGLFLRAGLDCSGKITVADIGIPSRNC